MKPEMGSLDGPRGLKLATRTWRPERTARAAILLVHGLAEHCGRYGNLVERALPRGYAVYGLDHVGHGLSEGARTFVVSFADLTEPLAALRARIRQEQPTTPIVLVGHSLGALIAAVHLLEGQTEYCAAVLSGALVCVPDNVSPATVLLSRLISRILPRLRLVGVEAAGVSRDPQVVRAYRDDPLVFHGRTTARLGYEILGAIQRVCANAVAIRLPLLMLHGTEDRLTPVGGACSLHEKISSEDKTLRLYEGLHHEVCNEPERDQVLGDVFDWIEARLHVAE